MVLPLEAKVPLAYTKNINLERRNDLLTLPKDEIVDAFLLLQGNYRELYKLYLAAEDELEEMGFFE